MHKSTLTTKEFINRAKSRHGDKYDYSLVKYTYASNKVSILCPQHGEFSQIAANHINGLGCPMCSKEKTTEGHKQRFINRSISTHGGIYDYSDVVYVDKNTKIKIICPQHGTFKQTPSRHIKVGCPICHVHEGRKITKDFIISAKTKHGSKYDYSNTVYITNKDTVSITCPDHGPFKQTAASHLAGCGCPVCANIGHLKRHSGNGSGRIYVLRVVDNDGAIFYKLGSTVADDIRKRYHGYSQMPYNYMIIFNQHILNSCEFEPAFHALSESKGLNKYIPQIKFGGYLECYKQNPLDYVKVVGGKMLWGCRHN